MNIDDVFFAATEGNKEKLIELLEADEVDVNQYLKSTVGSEDVYVFLLFSVINHMVNNQFNYEILDILISYGVDVDKCVIVETDMYKREIPLLVYAIIQYKSLELAEYLLKRGANPNAIQTENYGRDYTEVYPLLYFAFKESSVDFVKMLLYYGADPNTRVCTFSQELASTQFVPLISYAVNNFLMKNEYPITTPDEELTYWMLGYGADIYIEVIPFIDNRGHETKFMRRRFYDHLCFEYKGCEYKLHNAMKRIGNTRFTPIHVSKEAFIRPEKRIAVTPNGNNSTATQQSVETPATDSNSQNQASQTDYAAVSEKLFDFYMKDLYPYIWRSEPDKKLIIFGIVALVLSVVSLAFTKVVFVPLLACAIALIAVYISKNNKYKESVREFEQKKAERRATKNSLKMALAPYIEGCGGKKHWWDIIDAYNPEYDGSTQCVNGVFSDLYNLTTTCTDFMIYGPCQRVSETRNVPHLNSMLRTDETMTGRVIDTAAENEKYFNIIIKEEVEPDKEYRIAELCFWSIEDGMKVYKHREALYSDEEIREQVDDYKSSLDSSERLHNAFYSNVGYTDEEMFYNDKMDYFDYKLRDNIRSDKLYEYEKQLRSQTRTTRELEDINVYNQKFRPVGIIAFDDNDQVVLIALYNEIQHVECYEVDFEKILFDVKQLKVKKDTDRVLVGNEYKYVTKDRDIKRDRIEVIKNLVNYKCKRPDFLASKPEYLSDEEWLMLLYVTQKTGVGADVLRAQMKQSFNSVVGTKQSKINEGKRVW